MSRPEFSDMSCAHRQCFETHLVRCCVVTLTLFFSSTVFARGIDDIRLSRIGDTSTVEIELGCSMRYISHTPSDGGIELRVQMSIGQDCRLALQGTWNELRRPIGSRMANLNEIEFDRIDEREAFVTLRFNSSVGFRIKQTSNRYMLTVVVDRSSRPPPQKPLPLPAENPPTATSGAAEPSGSREPARRIKPTESTPHNRFVIRLGILSETESPDFEALRQFQSHIVYTNDVVVDDRRWAELRLGFFDTEAEAQLVLDELDSPSAWITVANTEEQERARSRLFELPNAQAATEKSIEATASGTRTEATLDDEQLSEMLIDARAALLRQDYASSITIYARLLEEPGGSHRRVAREFLGVAYEKNEQDAHAQAEYQAYLEEFPDGPDARRVQQRLAAISVSAGPPVLTKSPVVDTGHAPIWDFYGSASQFYLRGVSLAEESQPDFVGQSALLSQAQVYVRRQGERFDLIGRANMGYLYDFVENGADDQALTSYAYLDITDTKYDLNARIGRQLQQSVGALGRFDGVHASYRWRPNLAVNVTFGFPVDSPRYFASSDHYFYGASVDVDNFANAWDFSVFTHQQSIDGISDRKAVGAEAQFHKSGLNIVGLLDYDASYNVINTALITGSWRMTDRLTVYGRFRGGAAPFLTTRNAIIGQPVNTIRELFDTYSEGQIRRLARNRTAEERAGSIGVTAALTTRLQLKTDVSYLEYSDTVASGGVAALPTTGPQYSWGGHLIGSGFVRAGQVLMLGYRHDETRSIDTDTLWFDARIPIGEKLRLQSRLSVSNRVANQNSAGDIEQVTINPVLRVLYVWKQRYRIEFELGGQWSNREFPAALAPPLTPTNEFENSDYYLQLGYTLDF